jgi:rubrerythrin
LIDSVAALEMRHLELFEDLLWHHSSGSIRTFTLESDKRKLMNALSQAVSAGERKGG